MSTPSRNAFGLACCPDCPAVLDDQRHLVHEDGCPVALDLDRMREDDAAWFDAHPGEHERQRPPTWSERVSLVAALGVDVPPGARWFGQVVVRRVAPGIRVKSFASVGVVLREATEVAS